MSIDLNDFYLLDAVHTDPKRVAKERAKARQLRQTQWWRNRLSRGLCHYCQQTFEPKALTMDHVVPIARGGSSTKGNIVPSCQACNAAKKLGTPAESLLNDI